MMERKATHRRCLENIPVREISFLDREVSAGNSGSFRCRSGKVIFLNLLGFECLWLKIILMPKRQILGWQNLFPLRSISEAQI